MFAPGSKESWLTCARKNGKSGLIAAVILACIAPDGPLRRENWRGIVVSMTGLLAGELRRQVEEIVAASDIAGVEVRRSPAPGRLIGVGGSVDILAADKASGHAARADLAIIDEAGLLPESRRGLWDAVKSCVSGRDGVLCGISVLGDGPMFRESLDRHAEPGVHGRRYEAPADCALDDPKAWAAANPGLASGIKSPDYMAHAAREAITNPAASAGFRSLDLNQPMKPSIELVCDPGIWARVEVESNEQLPPRQDRACLGVDSGGSASLTAASALWESGRLDLWVAMSEQPDPLTRGRRDGVGDAYVRAIDGGWVTVTGHAQVDVKAFLGDVLADLPPDTPMGCDRYRKAEMIDLLHALERRPPTRDRVAVLDRSRRAFESGSKTCPAEPTARRGMSFHRPASRYGMIVSEVGVPATAPGAARSGIALTNTSETAREVSLELTALDGTSTGVAASLDIPASGQVARLIDEIFPELTPPFSGILRIASTRRTPGQTMSGLLVFTEQDG